MARFEERSWEPDFAAPTRRDRRPCRYTVYLPDLLSDRRFSFDGDVAVDMADAEADQVRLNGTVGALADTEGLAVGRRTWSTSLWLETSFSTGQVNLRLYPMIEF